MNRMGCRVSGVENAKVQTISHVLRSFGSLLGALTAYTVR